MRGAISSLATLRDSGYLAIGTDQGYIGVYSLDEQNLRYQKQIASEISPSVVSMQFQTCVLDGFRRNILVAGRSDSSLLAFDGENGNSLSSSTVRPKKFSKAIFMQVLEFDDESGQKKGFVVACSEKGAYVYSLNHCIQGVKKAYRKKKFGTSSCFWASTFCTNLEVDRIIMFTSSKIEIRSLPDLTLISESSVHRFVNFTPHVDSIGSYSISCSQDGDIILVNGDQEVLFVSTLVGKEQFRNLDEMCQVYRKNRAYENKMGDFCYERSFRYQSETDEADCGVDKLKNGKLFDKKKLVGKFHSWKAKIRHIKNKNEKKADDNSGDKVTLDNNSEDVIHQIKKKYGFNESIESSNARNKLALERNAAKLQAISLQTSMLQDTALSFASMAKEMLRSAEKEKLPKI